MKRLSESSEMKALHPHELFRWVVEAAPCGMVVVDKSGTILMINSEAERLFGYRRDELLGERVEVLLPERHRRNHVPTRAAYSEEPTVRGMGVCRDLFARHKDGSEFPVEVALNPIVTADGPMVLASILNISDRCRIEKELKESLNRKETLLKEIHHRLKNNLAVISSLLGMEARRQTSSDLRLTLEESQNRVQSIALVHEQLYGSEELDRIDFSHYASELVPHLHDMFAHNRSGVRVEMKLQPVEIGIEKAIPCGLILNELITNAFKYAFPKDGEGTVTIGIEKTAPNQVLLFVFDNGVGIPEQFDWCTSKSMGLQVVKMLVKQINGAIQMVRGEGERGGVRFDVRFPISDPKAT